MSPYNKALTCIAAGIVAVMWINWGHHTTREPTTKVVQRSMNDKLDDIDNMVATILKCKPHFPGMSLAIVHEGKVIATRGYGHTDISRSVKVDENTSFGMGSLSKAFTAILALKVLKRHGLSRQTRVVDILGTNFRFHDEILNQHATMGDLLSHRLGLPLSNFVRYQSNFTRRDLPTIFRHLKMTKQFRSSFVYNNLVYGLVAYIIEQLEDRPFEELVEEHVFTRLGMNNTFLRGRRWPNTSVALPHILYGQSSYPLSVRFFRHFGSLGASGSVMTTPTDVARWLHVHLHEGRSPEGIQAIPKSVIKEAYRPQSIVPLQNQWQSSRPVIPVSFVTRTYAAGWRHGFYRGYPIITHTGTTLGYSAMITMIPSRAIGIYTSFNSLDLLHYTRDALHAYIADIFLDKQSWLNSSTICTFPEPWSPRINTSVDFNTDDDAFQPARNLTEYTGTYESEAFGQLFVIKNETYLQVDYGVVKLKLYANAEPDSFRFRGLDDTWFFIGDNVTFQYDSCKSSTVSITLQYFEKKDPPIFLKM